jgi:hypothetical protein
LDEKEISLALLRTDESLHDCRHDHHTRIIIIIIIITIIAIIGTATSSINLVKCAT